MSRPVPSLRFSGAALVAAILAQGCVSVRPWRHCAPPCDGPQFEKAEEVAVLDRRGRSSQLADPRWENAAEGETLVGLAASEETAPAGEVRIPYEQICLLLTRRAENGRIAANLVLVPIGIAVEFVSVAAMGYMWTGPQLKWGVNGNPQYANQCDLWAGAEAPQPAFTSPD
jgi:hypothetical protein